jgi:hypothetical protein
MKNKWVTLVMIFIALIALGFQIHGWYMQYTVFEKKLDGTKRTEQMNRNYAKISNAGSLNFDVKPDFKAKIKNFDIEINTSIGEKVEDDLSAMIWRYYPGKYALSKTPEGLAILRTIEWELDELLEANRSDNVEIEIEAIGSADALPFKKKVYYDGLLGDTLSNIRYYNLNKPDIPLYMTFIKGQTRITNEGLALLRAVDAVKYLYDKYDIIADRHIKIYTREFDKVGPEYRRLDLKITMKNVFLEDYNELDFGSKIVGKFKSRK